MNTRTWQPKATRNTSLTSTHPGLLQRKCACRGSSADCADCSRKRSPLQRHASSRAENAAALSNTDCPTASTVNPGAPSGAVVGANRDFSRIATSTDRPIDDEHPKERVDQNSDWPGDGHTRSRTLDQIGEELSATSQTLDAPTRRVMESRFGVEFGSVRIHVGQEAVSAAQVLRADAFTIGTHIFFGSGLYRPATREGRMLIAHELAHVVQQGNGTVSVGDPVASTTAVASLETEADTMAQEAVKTPEHDASAADEMIPKASLTSKPLGFLLSGSWRKPGQGFLDCVNECTSSQGFVGTLGGIVVGICGVIAVLAAAAATPETAGIATMPTAMLVAGACAGAALGVPTGIMAGCLWECRS